VRELLKTIIAESRHWTELRAHDRRSFQVLARKGDLEAAVSRNVAGVGVRVLANGTWGFSSTARADREGIASAVTDAIVSAEKSFGGRASRVAGLADAQLAVGDFESGDVADVRRRSIDEKVSTVLDAERRARASSSQVESAMARYSELVDEKWIVTSDGADAHTVDSKLDFIVNAVASRGADMTVAWKGVGVTGGWSDLFAEWSVERLVDHAAGLAVDLLSAPYAPGGPATVILNPELVGLLAHEAIGHTVEADFVLAGSAVSGRIGERVGSELVTLVDSGPALIGGPSAAGVVLVDDEGVPCGPTTIVDHGILRSYLHDRETAAIFGVAPTGNARAWQYDDEPLIRMRNTYIEPGESSLGQIIESVDQGLLLAGAGSGQADANAEFMFGVQEAREIRRGKIGRLLRGASISGDAFEVLSSIDMLSSDFSWNIGTGHCGKGQPAKVDAGGPHARCRVVVGGR
jgi:TldD protein